MLELKNIVKTYQTGDTTVSALDGVSLCFRENEFVSILGPSGCGKTTMLNIVGGLDRYTDGDLIINGKSTKLFKDSDWDTYRNHSIGFVFQSYNLIPHQTVLSNVELALTLSGVSKSERKLRAIEALKKVGLGDQLHKKPNQMSGGQMQRVAIARALVNNPDILLADEPTGALDTHTSVQIMELLKEVADDRLVIMVTHNPELAQQYSTRIVTLSDGKVTGDSNPITDDEYEKLAADDAAKRIQAKKDKKARKAEMKKTSMSFSTAVSLSLKNLLTKKGRTVLTSFAGSIGIIGIALILSLSNGIQIFIDQVQEDTLSTYPLSIYEQTQDLSAMMSAMTATSENTEEHEDDKIYVDNSLDTMVSAMTSTRPNNLEAFKKYIDENYDEIGKHVSDIQYTYNFDLQIFTNDGKLELGLETMFKNMGDSFSSFGTLMESSGGMGVNVFSEMINNQKLLDQQYDIVDGHWPTEKNEVVLVVDKNNSISKMALYMLGVLDQSELEGIMNSIMSGEQYVSEDIEPFPIEYFLDMSFKLVNTEDFYVPTDRTYTYNGETYTVWEDVREFWSEDKLAKFISESGTELKISGVVRPKVDASATSISGVIGYTKDLTDYILDMNKESEVIAQQIKTPEINVLTGLNFERTKYTPDNIGELINKIDDATMERFYAYMTEMIKTDEQYSSMLDVKDAESFAAVFFMLPNENKVELVNAMYKAAIGNPQNIAHLQDLTAVIDGITQPDEAFNVTPETLPSFIPFMDTQNYALLLYGPGMFADKFDLNNLDDFTKAFLLLPNDDRINLISTMFEAAKANPQNEYQIQALTTVIDGMMMPDEEFNVTPETFSSYLPLLNQKHYFVLLNGAEITNPITNEAMPVKGLVELVGNEAMQNIRLGLLKTFVEIPGIVGLAGEETMNGIYTNVSEALKTMEVNEEILLTIISGFDADSDVFVQLEEALYGFAPKTDATYKSTLEALGNAEKDKPASINFYAKDFHQKENVEQFISDYNAGVEEADKLEYTDIIGIMMSSVSIIVDVISYVLIAFVAISLVVSSIMIGIITNISVLERTKEIGILRAIGASKRDISRVFNAETFIIGLAAGIIGIVMTVLLCLPTNAIIRALTGFTNINATLPVLAAIILIGVSMGLTMLAGLIPSKKASKKDPVVALRTE